MKRIFDLGIAALILICLCPLLLTVGCLIILDDKGPVFYRQIRVGISNKLFTMLKFRSMKVNNIPVSEMGQVTSTNPLITRVGKVIRRFKIDELPQLLSVLKGDLSLVGPRPTVPEQAEQYNDFQKMRLKVKPGLTGWAQVNGNVNLTWNERIALDIWYIDHWSFRLDLKILFLTVWVILKGEHRNERILEEALNYANSTYRSS